MMRCHIRFTKCECYNAENLKVLILIKIKAVQNKRCCITKKNSFMKIYSLGSVKTSNKKTANVEIECGNTPLSVEKGLFLYQMCLNEAFC